MNAKVAILILGLIAQVYGACINCGFGPGRDTCKGAKCSPMIVRPNRLPKVDISELCKPRVICKQVTGFQPLKPLGDLCSCNRAIVTPAFIPKPACALCAKPCISGSSSSSSGYEGASSYDFGHSGSSEYSGHHSGAHSGGHSAGHSGGHSGEYSGNGVYSGHGSSGYTFSSGGDNSEASGQYSGGYITESGSPSAYETVVSTSGSSGGSGSSSSAYGINTCDQSSIHHAYKAADAVSLSLAYKLQNEMNNIAEDKLFFGFTKMPREIQIAKKAKNTIAEENLYTHNGQVVELKHMMVGNGKSLDEEANEALMYEELNEDVDTGAHHGGVAKLTYGQIGFGPAKIKEVPCVSVHGDGVESVATSSCGVQACNDGYVSGKVLMNPIRKSEVYVQSKPVYDDEYEEDSGAVSYPAFSYSASSSASHGSASSSHHHHQSGSKIVFEKLGCGDD